MIFICKIFRKWIFQIQRFLKTGQIFELCEKTILKFSSHRNIEVSLLLLFPANAAAVTTKYRTNNFKNMFLNLLVKCFMQSSASAMWVPYLDNSFWYWGIFFSMALRSFTVVFSPEPPVLILLLAENSLNSLVTSWVTLAMCLWRSCTQQSSFSFNQTCLVL